MTNSDFRAQLREIETDIHVLPTADRLHVLSLLRDASQQHQQLTVFAGMFRGTLHRIQMAIENVADNRTDVVAQEAMA